jgi:hypothetical protein
MICNKCNEEKPLTDFNRDRKTANGRKRTCKKCDRLAVKDYYQRNSETIKKKTRDRYRKKKNERS